MFKLIHDLCLGEVSLTQSDLSLLAKHLEEGEKGEAKQPEEQSVEEEQSGGKGRDAYHKEAPILQKWK